MAKNKMTNLDKILKERAKTHGDFTKQSKTAQVFKYYIRKNLQDAELHEYQLEALDMIVHKIARIVCGNPNEPDHWDDIAGYATLVSRLLQPKN